MIFINMNNIKLQFIEKANKYHHNKYDYSLVNYINSITKIKIICPIHGEFEQIPKGHLKGGCKLCGIMQIKNKKLKSNNDFITKSIIKHDNKYNYTISDYKGAHNKLKIICPTHGEFEQTPNNHLKGHGCPHCTYNLSNTETFIKRAKLIHNNKYDYSKVIYTNNKSDITIICKYQYLSNNFILKKQLYPQYSNLLENNSKILFSKKETLCIFKIFVVGMYFSILMNTN